MSAWMRILAIALLLSLTVGLSYEDSESFCVIFPQFGRDIFGTSQRSILIFGQDEVSLIPQVNFEGDARDFGILIPVPALPTLSTVESTIFSEASFLTQPLVRSTGSGCGCDESDRVISPVVRTTFDVGRVELNQRGGVTVVYEQQVGMFLATVLQATSAGDLTKWLQENGYRYNRGDSTILESYVARNWYFVAMKLDTSQVPRQINRWWSASTRPARITFPYSDPELTYPLKISSISTRLRAEVLVYTIGPEPMRFPGARVEYANFVDEQEAEQIRSRYTVLGQFIEPGVFITKLRRNFHIAEMNQDIQLVPTQDRREFREILYTDRGTGTILFLAMVILGLGRVVKGRFRTKRPT